MSDAAETESRRQFGALVSGPEESLDLAAAALLIAREEYPDLDLVAYLDRLDAMAAIVLARVGGGATDEERLEALGKYLFEEQGFHGNTREYYDPRNSFLNDVLDRRTGIPITLSTVYMEVGRRLRLTVAGVALPGHFIVKVTTSGGDRLLDPFHGGASLSQEDCQERLDRIFGDGKVKVQPPMLAACSRKQILARMLRNLKGIYLKCDDHARALGIVDLLLRLEPDSAEELHDRGLLYAALDCYSLAVRDLEAYVALAPGSPRAEDALEKIIDLRRRAARLN
jgi:regulator of sirC expression with transglutaminase-like and TPR domain